MKKYMLIYTDHKTGLIRSCFFSSLEDTTDAMSRIDGYAEMYCRTEKGYIRYER